MGRWNIECKAYKKGFEPAKVWWDQVLGVNGDGEFPALVYKFDNKPIRVRIMVKNLNEQLSDTTKLVDLNWESFIYLLNEKYQIDLEDINSGFLMLQNFCYKLCIACAINISYSHNCLHYFPWVLIFENFHPNKIDRCFS